MTKNQIDYWNLKENQRHNQAAETETSRHNLKTEAIDLGNLNESIRHNVVTENETGRHNRVTENETQRHNIATEGETQRHNLTTEGQTNVDLSRRDRELAEVMRHNAATEALTGADLNIKAANLAETSRHNIQTEQIGKLTARAQALKDQSQTNLNNLKAQWENLNQQISSEISAAQQREINARIKQIEQQTALLGDQSNLYKMDTIWNDINSSINSVGSLLRGIGGLVN